MGGILVKGMHVGGGKKWVWTLVWGERDSQKGNDMVYVHVIFFLCRQGGSDDAMTER